MPDTCVIIGNGPSLRDVPLDFLQAFPTFGANRIYTYFLPDYFVCINPLVLQQNKKDIEALQCKKFVRAGMGMSGTQLHKSIKADFSFSPLSWVNEGYNVTYVSLQLAYDRGYETVLLVGLDHDYPMSGEPNKTATMQGDDPNHFSPDYFKGQEWQYPDLRKSEHYFRIARDVFEGDLRRIYNLTPNSKLDVFEKRSIDEWMPLP